MKQKRRKRTRTSSFGSSGRVSHDASHFYGGKLYAGVRETEPSVMAHAAVPPDALDRIIAHSSERMSELPDASIHLMITSPPYNVRKEYDDDFTLSEYRAFLRRVFAETLRVLVPGGRACINVASVGRRPYVPLHAYLAQDLIELGFLMRGEVIWNKGSSAGPSTAWGSWRSASNPTLRDVHEYVLVFSKETFSRNGQSGPATISREEFLEYTKSIWTFNAESARRIGHPAPFPVELPRRLIELYSFQGDVVLDPFAGSGTTCLAALQSGRHYVGYERVKTYVALAERRIRESMSAQQRDGQAQRSSSS